MIDWEKEFKEQEKIHATELKRMSKKSNEWQDGYIASEKKLSKLQEGRGE